MHQRAAALAIVLAVSAAACGSDAGSSDVPAASDSTGGDATLAPVDSGAPTSVAQPSDDPSLEPCGVDDTTSLADAQFAFVGTVLSVAEQVHPWTTDPENPERPDVATTTRWVTFDVEGWYTDDWGTSFPVWMRTISLDVGDRAAVAGDAYHTEVVEFSGQSGGVDVCAPLAGSEASPPAWDEFFGAVVPPLDESEVVDTAPPAVDATLVFDQFADACSSTVLTNGPDDERDLAAGATCFVREVDAGRAAVWDVVITTVEGDPIPTRYDYDGTTVTITTDYSFDNFGSGGVGERVCSGVQMFNWLPEGVDCTVDTNDGVGFVADSLPFGG